MLTKYKEAPLYLLQQNVREVKGLIKLLFIRVGYQRCMKSNRPKSNRINLTITFLKGTLKNKKSTLTGDL